jgi:DNA polymerase
MDEPTKARVRLYLRSEKAMGLGAVPFIDLEPAVSPGEVHTDSSVSRVERLQHSAPHRQSAMPAVPVTPQVPQPSGDMGQAMKPVGLVPISTDVPFASPLLATQEKRNRLGLMNAEEVSGCVKCRLCETRTQTVFGEGDVDAKIFFIGEGPGETEDETGRPFVGRAGQLLDKMIAAMGLSREQVYIANIVKCRPPNNRVPAPDEVTTCTPYLERQLEIIRPAAIVTLGLPSTQYMLKTKLSMGKLRGNWHSWRGIKLMPTYHPAYVLRNPTLETRAAVWSDLKQVLAELGLPIPKKNI